MTSRERCQLTPSLMRAQYSPLGCVSKFKGVEKWELKKKYKVKKMNEFRKYEFWGNSKNTLEEDFRGFW